MPEKSYTAYPLRGSYVHRPFDKTIKSLCEENSEIKRRSFATRLQHLVFFRDKFFADPNTPSEHRIRTGSRYTINLNWESAPLLRAYYDMETKWTRSEGEITFKENLDKLDKYKEALTKEKGQYFSVFRDTDPLYLNLVMKEKVLELLPERLSLLIASTIIGSVVGSAGRLKATIDIMDSVIEQNIAAIIGNDLSAENLNELLQNNGSCFSLEKSIESLYTRLESERATSDQNSKFVFNNAIYNTFGIKTYPDILKEDQKQLKLIFEYFNLADKESEHNKMYHKRKNPLSVETLKTVEKKAENAYDKYRKNHLPTSLIKDAVDFNKAVHFLEKPDIGKGAIEILNNDSTIEFFMQFLLLLSLDEQGYLFCSIPCFTRLKTETTCEEVFMSDPGLTYDCQHIVSEILTTACPIFQEWNSYSYGNTDTPMSLPELSKFLLGEVFKDLCISDNNNLDSNYIYASITRYLKTELSYEPRYPQNFYINANEIVDILNITTANRNDININDRGNLIILYQALLNAWVIRRACEEAKKYVVNKRKIIEFKKVLLESIFGSESGVDESVVQNVRKSVDEIYKQIFETSSSINDNSSAQT